MNVQHTTHNKFTACCRQTSRRGVFSTFSRDLRRKQSNRPTITLNWRYLNSFPSPPWEQKLRKLFDDIVYGKKKKTKTFSACKAVSSIKNTLSRTIDVIILPEINDIIDIIADKETSPGLVLDKIYTALLLTQFRYKILFTVIIFQLMLLIRWLVMPMNSAF